jgi:hypothetical protein
VLAAAGAFAASAVSAPTDEPAPPTSPDFTVAQTAFSPPGACAVEPTTRQLIGLLRAFNSGYARAFSRRFEKNGGFHPYTGLRLAVRGWQIASGVSGRAAIERVVRARHAAGDGWTATKVLPPQRAGDQPERAVYGLSLQVTRGARTPYTSGSKIIVRCSSGRIIRWVGPVGR